jgi:hypothetical protein
LFSANVWCTFWFNWYQLFVQKESTIPCFIILLSGNVITCYLSPRKPTVWTSPPPSLLQRQVEAPALMVTSEDVVGLGGHGDETSEKRNTCV